MRKVVYQRFGDASGLEVVEVPSPPPPGPGELQIRVAAAALNPKDVLVRKGKFKLLSGSRFPRGVGYDFAGTVVGGARFEPGTRVFGMVNGWDGRTVAEELVCAEHECELMPDMGFEEAVAIPLAGQTALQALRDIGRVSSGDTVCINGASGGVGVFAVQIAKILGARVITVSSERNLALCRDLGADETLDYERDDPFARPAAYDVVFDVFGNRRYTRVRPALQPGGTFVSTVPSPRIYLDAVRTLSGWGKRARLVLVTSRARDLATLHDWVDQGKLIPVVDRSYPLGQVADAQRYLETKRARGKVVVRVQREG